MYRAACSSNSICLDWSQNNDDYLIRTFIEYMHVHPTYIVPLIKAHKFVLYDVGPLAPVVRHYIGILAAARHRCSFIVKTLTTEYASLGGNKEWLEGFHKCPPKLKKLNELNKLIAHQPWLINKEHVEFLRQAPNSWSVSEIMHAMVLMAHFNMLCTLAFGCKFGIAPPCPFHEEAGSLEFEVEELQLESMGEASIYRKVLKKSPLAELVSQRCKQLQLEEENMSKLLNNFRFETKESRKVRLRLEKKRVKADRFRKKTMPQAQQSPALEVAEVAEEVTQSYGLDLNQPQARPGASVSSASSASNNTSHSSASVASNSTDNTKSCASRSSSSSSVSSISGGEANRLTFSSVYSSRANANTDGAPKVTNAKRNSSGNINKGAGTSSFTRARSLSSCNSSFGHLSHAYTQFPREMSTRIVKIEVANSDAMWRENDYDRYRLEAEFGYVDFCKHQNDAGMHVTTFRMQDYDWDEQAFSIVNMAYPESAAYLDEKFKIGYNLTYYTVGPKTNVDTSLFRRAVWYYVQCLFGIRSDDYNYREVNIFLERNLKQYIKQLACFPERIPNHDHSNVMHNLWDSEKVHVIIMVAEAKLQAQILYVAKAVNNLLKSLH